MEKELKIFLGKILGEIYQLKNQLNSDGNNESEQKIFGLINGFEFVIDEEIKDYSITKEDYDNMVNILNPIFYDKQKLDEFSGYYDIENQLKKVGIDRGKAALLFNFFSKGHSFMELIEKLKDNSPSKLTVFPSM